MRKSIIPVVLLGLLYGDTAGAWLVQKTGTAAGAGQVMLGTTTGNLAAAAVRYLAINYGVNPTGTDTAFTKFTVAGTITSLRFKVMTAPAGAATWTIELRKNGSNTGLNCQITSASSPAGTCSGTGSVSFSAGDYGNLRVTPANTPTASLATTSALFIPATSGDSIIAGQGGGFSNSAAQAALPFNNITPATSSSRRQAAMPAGGTIDRLFVGSTAPGTAGQTTKFYDWDIFKNNSAQSFTCHIAADATECNDTATSFSVAGPSGATAGDDLAFVGTPSGTPSSATAVFGARFRATLGDYFSFMMTSPLQDNNASTFYYPMAGFISAGSTTESANQTISDSMTVTAIAVKTTVAPGSGKSRAYTLRVNGSNSALTCTIANTDTACTATGTVSVSNDDLLSTGDAPTGTPLTGIPAISYLAHR